MVMRVKQTVYTRTSQQEGYARVDKLSDALATVLAFAGLQELILCYEDHRVLYELPIEYACEACGEYGHDAEHCPTSISGVIKVWVEQRLNGAGEPPTEVLQDTYETLQAALAELSRRPELQQLHGSVVARVEQEPQPTRVSDQEDNSGR